jgi:hypothetical protein
MMKNIKMGLDFVGTRQNRFEEGASSQKRSFLENNRLLQFGDVDCMPPRSPPCYRLNLIKPTS